MINEQEPQNVNEQSRAMSVDDFGARLRALRQSKGLSLEDAARHIKLSKRTLLSIEEGRREDLPHPVYAKGFVRTYSQFLGMPEDELAESMNNIFPPEEEEYVAPVLIRQPRKGNPVWTVVILLLLAVLGIGAWYVYSNLISHRSDEQPVAPSAITSSVTPLNDQAEMGKILPPAETPPAAPDSLAEENWAPVPQENTTQAAPPVSSAAPEAATPDVQAGVVNELPNSDVEGPIYFESGRGVVDNPEEQPPAASPSGGKKNRVVITATEECWIKATSDSGDERPFNLPKNQSSVFTFDKFLKLRLGNVGGVKIRYNGRDFPIPSGPGNTRDLVFPPKDS